jgi:hypothetical protein
MSDTNGSTTTGRDPRGWFAKGNKIAAGNPMNLRMRELKQALLDCATEADIRDLYASLMESARAGDTAATRLLFEYLCGRPTQGIALSGPEGEPLAIGAIIAVVTEALADHPEARTKVAAAFHQLGRSRDGLPRLGQLGSST